VRAPGVVDVLDLADLEAIRERADLGREARRVVAERHEPELLLARRVVVDSPDEVVLRELLELGERRHDARMAPIRPRAKAVVSCGRGQR
jgi:hypothetical protein